jgi:hypothetical protein
MIANGDRDVARHVVLEQVFFMARRAFFGGRTIPDTVSPKRNKVSQS